MSFPDMKPLGFADTIGAGLKPPAADGVVPNLVWPSTTRNTASEFQMYPLTTRDGVASHYRTIRPPSHGGEGGITTRFG